MDRPPFWDAMSVWIDARTGCYSGADLGGSRVTGVGVTVQSIKNARTSGGHFNAIDHTTYPLEYQVFQGIPALYCGHYVSALAGMQTPISLAHAEFFALIASPATTWRGYGSPVTGSGKTRFAYYYGIATDPNTTKLYHIDGRQHSPTLCFRNGVDVTSSRELAPINEWFLIRYRLGTGSATVPMRLFSLQHDSNLHTAKMYLGSAVVYDRELSSAEASTVEQWFERQYPGLTLI
jgi:hypothetical protein